MWLSALRQSSIFYWIWFAYYLLFSPFELDNFIVVHSSFSLTDGARFGGSCLIHGPPLPPLPLHAECETLSVSGDAGIEEVKSPVLRSPPTFSHSRCPPEVHRSCICVRFIAEHTKMLEDSTKVNSHRSLSLSLFCLYKFYIIIYICASHVLYLCRWKRIGSTLRWC